MTRKGCNLSFRVNYVQASGSNIVIAWSESLTPLMSGQQSSDANRRQRHHATSPDSWCSEDSVDWEFGGEDVDARLIALAWPGMFAALPHLSLWTSRLPWWTRRRGGNAVTRKEEDSCPKTGSR